MRAAAARFPCLLKKDSFQKRINISTAFGRCLLRSLASSDAGSVTKFDEGVISMKLAVVAATSCIFLVAQAFAEPKPKVSICHLDEEEGTWVTLSISENGAAAHLRNHDDGAPEGVTSQSGTQLDANCAAAVEQPQ
jgi:hypothetical protein